MTGRDVRFQIDIAGTARAHVPDDISESEIKEYLANYMPMYAGNKMFDIWKVRISDVVPDE